MVNWLTNDYVYHLIIVFYFSVCIYLYLCLVTPTLRTVDDEH